MSHAEVRSRVCRRLGKEVCDEGPRPLCFGVMDRWGVHAECCMGGGDKTEIHHCVRNRLYRQSRFANFGPQLEKGVDRVLGLDSDGRENDRGRERPADVLLVRARDLHTGVQGRVEGRVALDVGIVCPQSASHRAIAARENLGAAEAYVRHKCSRNDMEAKCRAAGVVFQPMIFESLGGVSIEAKGVIKSINNAVAENVDSPVSEIAQQFWWGVSVDIQKAQHKALAKRTLGLGVWGSSLGIGA